MFFRNGYEALASLDDNHDGLLSGVEIHHRVRVSGDADEVGTVEGGRGQIVRDDK